jgi:hypothetical protein
MVLDLEEKVATVAKKLKKRGLVSPYLRSFVVARINPLHWIKGEPPPFEEVLKTMRARAAKFNVEKIKPQDLAEELEDHQTKRARNKALQPRIAGSRFRGTRHTPGTQDFGESHKTKDFLGSDSQSAREGQVQQRHRVWRPGRCRDDPHFRGRTLDQ